LRTQQWTREVKSGETRQTSPKPRQYRPSKLGKREVSREAQDDRTIMSGQTAHAEKPQRASEMVRTPYRRAKNLPREAPWYKDHQPIGRDRANMPVPALDARTTLPAHWPQEP